jgi:hypothetical protein
MRQLDDGIGDTLVLARRRAPAVPRNVDSTGTPDAAIVTDRRCPQIDRSDFCWRAGSSTSA